MHSRFIKYYVIFLVVLAIPFGHSLMFLYRAGELKTPQQIAKAQYEGKTCIFGSALKDDVISNKLQMYKLKKPDVIALGSSRNLQLREEFFKDSFYNMGFTVASISAGETMLKEILKIHKPKLVIMNVDFWWFHEGYRKPGEVDEVKIRDGREMSFNYITRPYDWLKKGKITAREFFLTPYTKHNTCNFGVKGFSRNAGYAADGSYYYTDLLSGNLYNEKTGITGDFKFKNVDERITEGKRNFNHGSIANQQHFDEFVKLVEKFKSEGVDVVLFMPPLAPYTVNKMKEFDYSYVDDLRGKFKAAGINVYDYNDISKFSSDCEFVDGFHAGDLAYAKVLYDLAKKDAKVRKVVKMDYLKEVTGKYNGLAMIPNKQVMTAKELDFLGIGCTK